jgi:hypothetical protein
MTERQAEGILRNVCRDKAVTDPGYAIAYGLLALAEAQRETAEALRRLGNNDAATAMGALEMLGHRLGGALDNLADAVATQREDE